MIQCPLCYKLFKQISRTHLKFVHNMSVSEFILKFPNFSLSSEELKNQRKKSSLILSEKLKNEYYKNPYICKKCAKIIPFEKRENKFFCNCKCAGSYNTIGKHHKEETKLKIKNTINNSIKLYGPYKQSHTYVVRSKNEIKLFEIMSKDYVCLHNKRMFNNRDADIIIPDLKLAILWNGIWHYEQVIKNRSIKQMINMDDYKLRQIKKCGYNFIIVKDHNNKITPEIAYNRIKECIRLNIFDLTIF